MKHFAGYIIFLFLLLIQSKASAQKNKRVYEDSIFNKNTAPGIRQYDDTKLYYISLWKDLIPAQVKIIKKIDERIAIIEVNDERQFDSLKQRIKISAANNSWKFSPALEKSIEKKNDDDIHKYILTGLSIDSLLLVLRSNPKELIILTINTSSHSVIVKCKTKYLKDYVLPLREVIFL